MTTNQRLGVTGIIVTVVCGYYVLDHRQVPDRHVFANVAAADVSTPAPTSTPTAFSATPAVTPTLKATPPIWQKVRHHSRLKGND